MHVYRLVHCDGHFGELMSEFDSTETTQRCDTTPRNRQVAGTDLSAHTITPDRDFLLQGALRPMVMDRLLSKEESQAVVDNAWKFIDSALKRGSQER